MTARRSFLRSLLGTAVASPAAAVPGMGAVVESLVAAAPAAAFGSAALGAAVKAMFGYMTRESTVEFLSDEVIQLDNVRSYYGHSRIPLLYHTKALVSATSNQEALLGDEVSRERYLDWVERYYIPSNYFGSPLDVMIMDREALLVALKKYGRLEFAKSVKQCWRYMYAAGKMRDRLSKQFRNYGIPCDHPLHRRFDQLQFEQHESIDDAISNLRRMMLELRDIKSKMGGAWVRPLDGAVKRLTRLYARTRRALVLGDISRERSWLNDVQLQRSRYATFARSTIQRGFARASDEMARTMAIRQVLVEAMSEHLKNAAKADGPCSNIGVETCLRVLRRVDLLMSVVAQRLIVPEKITPEMVLSGVVSGLFNRVKDRLVETYNGKWFLMEVDKLVESHSKKGEQQ